VIECAACHTTDLGVTLGGPHGMHPVGASLFLDDHKEIAEHHLGLCRTCHGANLLGTVLSRVAVNRTLWNDEQHRWENFVKGEQVACDKCHSMP